MLSKKRKFNKTTNLSVIFSVYYGDKLNYFINAFHSISNQTLRAKQIVVVMDGKLKRNLYDYLLVLKKKKKIKLVNNPQNRGQGYARHIGIKGAKYPIVAVMDSDDISDPKRFEIQINCLKKNNYDIVGCNIAEFSKSLKKIDRYRKVPENHNEILKLSNWRTPMNGATVVFKKSSYLTSKGYPFDVKNFEDYILILRFIKNKFKCYNVQENLYFVRTTKDWIKRRSGFDYLKSEINLSNYLYKYNFINFFSFACHIFLRIIIRSLPEKLILEIYKKIFRQVAK